MRKNDVAGDRQDARDPEPVALWQVQRATTDSYPLLRDASLYSCPAYSGSRQFREADAARGPAHLGQARTRRQQLPRCRLCQHTRPNILGRSLGGHLHRRRLLRSRHNQNHPHLSTARRHPTLASPVSNAAAHPSSVTWSATPAPSMCGLSPPPGYESGRVEPRWRRTRSGGPLQQKRRSPNPAR